MGKWYDNVIENDVKKRSAYVQYWVYPLHLKKVAGDFDYCVYDKDKRILEELTLFYKHIKTLDCINLILFVIGFFCFITWIINIFHLINRQKYKKELEIKINSESYVNQSAKVFEEIAQDNIMFVLFPVGAGYPVRYGANILKDVIKTPVPYIELDCWELYFIEKGILFYNSQVFWLLPYKEFNLTIQETTANIINPPENAEIISTTWEHVKKDGTPNKKYKDNQEINTIKAWVISLKSTDNANVCFEFVLFNKNAAYKFYDSIKQIKGEG